MILLRNMSAQVAVASVAVVAMLALIVPLRDWMLDLLLSANLALSLAVFTLALLVRRPVRLEGFPALLVVSSLGRVILALAVARNILMGGDGGSLVAGLGGIGGSGGWLAGIVVVLVVALIDLLVISSGMVRVSEVLARFALDALPGRQMAVDAAIADGRLSPQQASDRQRHIDLECAFYGAMDGAARFLRGDCIATVIAVAATPVAALLINQPEAAGDMATMGRYLQLATGHGLVILLPAVLVGGAGAMVLARAGSDRMFGAEIAGELAVQPIALGAACLVLLVTAFVSPPARLSLMAMAVGLAAVGFALRKRTEPSSEGPDDTAPGAQSPKRIEIGLGLSHLIEQKEFQSMVTQMRSRVQRRLGLEVGPFAVVDSAELGMDRVAMVLNGATVGQQTVRAGRLLAVGGRAEEFPGAIPARCGAATVGAWILPEHEQTAGEAALQVLEPTQALLLLVEETLLAGAGSIFDLQQAAEMIAQAEQSHPQAVAAARDRGLDAVLLRKVGAALLAERVGIHSPVSLVQAMAESLADIQDMAELVETVRRLLSRAVCQAAAPDGIILALELAPELTDELAACYHEGRLAIPPERAQQYLRFLDYYGTEAYRLGHPIAVLCDARLRPAIGALIADSGQSLLAVSYDELEPEYSVEYLATVTAATLQ